MGLLAAALGEREAAGARLAQAEAIEVRGGAHLRAEHTRRARAQLERPT